MCPYEHLCQMVMKGVEVWHSVAVSNYDQCRRKAGQNRQTVPATKPPHQQEMPQKLEEKVDLDLEEEFQIAPQECEFERESPFRSLEVSGGHLYEYIYACEEKPMRPDRGDIFGSRNVVPLQLRLADLPAILCRAASTSQQLIEMAARANRENRFDLLSGVDVGAGHRVRGKGVSVRMLQPEINI